ncbi:MAG: TetR/AcrR family transcriptional regulator [Hellea sp.]|nr:TetR/AcrR family transcriptional regulator [Hellea sp.]
MSQSRQRLDPEARRRQLIDLAMQVFATDGLERAGHGDIAKLAGVSTATVFNYFPTREDLVEAVLEEVREQFRAMFAAFGDVKTEQAIGVRVMVAGFNHLIENRPNMIKTFLRWTVAFGDQNRKAYLDFQDEMLTEISKRLKNSTPDRSDARIIMGSADMYALMKLDNTPDDVIARFVDRLLSVLGE